MPKITVVKIKFTIKLPRSAKKIDFVRMPRIIIVIIDGNNMIII